MCRSLLQSAMLNGLSVSVVIITNLCVRVDGRCLTNPIHSSVVNSATWNGDIIRHSIDLKATMATILQLKSVLITSCL